MLLSQRLLTRARITAVAAVAAVLAVLAPGAAHAAAPPSNDDLDHPTPVAALPFTTQQDTSGATKAVDDPYFCQGSDVGGTVWFQYTATEDGLLRATTTGSDYSTILSAYTGLRGDLRAVSNACGAGRDAKMTFRATAGTTYYFMVAGYDVAGGALSFAVDRTPPAANDDFAAAEPFSTLPLTRQPDLSTASIEADEPTSTCDSDLGKPSVWYAYTTPGAATSVTAQITGYNSAVTVYTGNSLPELKQVACARDYSQATVFRANPGTTYYVRVTGSYVNYQPVTLTLAEAPPLSPQLNVSPYTPSVFDNVGFSASSWNPIDQPLTAAWDFGDGATAPAGTASVSHHYTADGVYTVTMRAASPDGRTATVTTQVTVTTHDVGITKFDVPASARDGQQKSITVHVANTRYPEKVTVMLSKSDGSSWTEVGSLTLDVPARANRTVQFPFAYTFTPQDAVVGKVSFRADAQLAYPAQDARPADNEVIAIATTVRPRSAVTKSAS